MEIARYILSHTVSLEKIIVNPHHPFIVTIEDTDEQLKATSRARQHLEHRLPPGAQLVVVGLIGFVGCGVDMEIARYILSHTVSLEKIIVNPHHPFIVTIEDTDEQLKATSRARQHLEHRLPPGAQLVIGCLSPTESAIMEDLGLSLAEVGIEHCEY
nr:hypothetical protein CFP56_44202 [Quercus suber]